MKKILRISNVVEFVGLSRSTIYNYISIGAFPKSVQLGPRAVGWKLEDIESWISARERKNG